MPDLILVLITLAFFGLSVLYVYALDRMIRNDDIEDPASHPVKEGVR